MIVLPPEILTQPGFTRAGPATFVGANGLMQTAAANVLRPLYVGGELRGVLIEGAGVNYFTYSENFADASWQAGLAGFFAHAASPIADVRGTFTARRFTTTISNGLFLRKVHPYSAATGPCTVSLWIRVTAFSGVASWAFQVDVNDAYLGTYQASTVFGQWVRVKSTFTPGAGGGTWGTDFNFFVNGVSGPPVGLIFDICFGQLDVGTVETSYIPTTAAAATRAADVLTSSGRDVLYSNAVEPSPEWVSGGNYLLGDVRIRATTRRRYSALVANTGSAIAPESDPDRWKDIGAINHLAMFDQGRNLKTVGPVGSKLRVAIYCSGRINSLFLARLEASYGTVVMYAGGVEVYRKDLTLTRRKTTSWSKYVFGTFEQLSSVMLTDLPMLAGCTIVLELDNGAYAAKCASMVISQRVALGDTEWGGSSDPLVFSVVNRDDYGNAELVPRRMAPATSQVLKIPVSQIPAAIALRDRLNARFAVWAGMNDNTESPWSEMFLICGIFTRFKITALNAKEAGVDIDLQEF